MRRRPSQTQAVEEIEDEAAEAAELCRMLMDDDEAEGIKKKKMKPVGKELGFGSINADCTKKTKTIVKKVIRTSLSNGSFIDDPKEVENFPAKRNLSGKIQAKKGIGKIDVHLGLLKKKSKAVGDGFKNIISTAWNRLHLPIIKCSRKITISSIKNKNLKGVLGSTVE